MDSSTNGSPPEVLRPFLRDSMRELAKNIALENACTEKLNQASDRKAALLKRRKQDYTAQIKAIVDALPTAAQNRAWTVQEICQRLQGRWKERPHAGIIGMALRELGYVQKRSYKKQDRQKRYWALP